MTWSKIDSGKYDGSVHRKLLAQIEEQRAAMEQARTTMEQADGTKVSAVPFERVQAYQKALDDFNAWLQTFLR